MKQIILCTLFFLTCSAMGQSLNCEDLKEGTFYIPKTASVPVTIKIVRTEKTQTEEAIDAPEGITDPDLVGIFHETIEWVSDCSFLLKFDETKMELTEFQKEVNEGGGVLTEIYKIEGDCYFYHSTLRIEDEPFKYSAKMCKTLPKN